MTPIMILCSILFSLTTAWADFPVIDQLDVVPNDPRLKGPIDVSKPGELTIASFNVRNLGSRQRSLKDFEAIVDLIDEADVVMVQEAGLGVYDGRKVSNPERERLDAVVAVFQMYLGSGWVVTRAVRPSGTGAGRETAMLAYRRQAMGYSMDATWAGYVDLGEKRDMATFRLTLIQDETANAKDLLLGSVHLTPDDPDRGSQMIKVAAWMEGQSDERAIAMGDFNWGYRKKSGVENYRGEAQIRALHENGKLFQVFHALSYEGASKDQQLRTNMGFRKKGYFYDQFLLTPILASEMADGGKFLEDCGLIAFGVHYRHMKDVTKRAMKRRQYGLDRFIKNAAINTEETHTKAYAKTLREIERQAKNDATWILSDHRVIWMQLKVW
ncbi:endonuclease/exonuclease/phosphatase family protein [Candidatus Entotheonella palauensis]|uniref:endonuclease/exonuclease/phosphatase family protein n=1 Tax=Candidatus Entotheonella palauensis TaxID=93172 RepID=UPI000B7F835C|nr:endonuclease/exonuclease/phosphatase family protein [Candidatus Entotheonella palauensis]